MNYLYLLKYPSGSKAHGSCFTNEIWFIIINDVHNHNLIPSLWHISFKSVNAVEHYIKYNERIESVT